MWSITMEPGKKYSTVVDQTFHLSMAVLDLDTVKKGNGDDIHTIYVETDGNQRAILCHLSKASKIYQCKLDHVFLQGTNLQFVTKASANIHMTGYVDCENEFNSDMESLSGDEDTPVLNKTDKGIKRKSDIILRKSKSLKLEENSEENSDDESLDFDVDDSDEEEGTKLSDFLDEEADEVEDGDETDDDIEDEEDDDSDGQEVDDEEEIEDRPVLTKKVKKENQTPKKQVNGNEQKTPKQEKKTPKKEQKTLKKEQKTPISQEKTPKSQKTPKQLTSDSNKSLLNGSNEESNKGKKDHKTPLGALKTKPDTPIPKDKSNQHQKLNGGVVIHDLKVGDGAVAKPGKNVKVYYIGRLKSTGKVFDSMQKGSGFTFGLQRGEVIKGWDIGIAGMKVGGKRKVICPPNMAYGAKGSPPEIPPNSTLVFEVELKHVN